MDATDLYSLQNAAFYDASHGGYAADCAFWLKMAKKNPGPLLELACGSGRIGIELVKAGFDYTGLDASGGMLSLFASKWETLGRKGEPPLRLGDMRQFKLGRRFQLILITFNSLQHVHTDAEVLKAFDCCRGHLEKGGRFCFDVFNPDRRILNRDPSVRHPLPKFMDEARGLWCELSETNWYDEASQINRIQWFYRYENGEEGTFKLEMRQFFPQEMDALIERAGFRILNKWGDFVSSGFSSASPRQVFECAIEDSQ